jgi:Ca2+-binding RTX toxin-like protein
MTCHTVPGTLVNCVGTNNDDVIFTTGPGPFGFLIEGREGNDVIHGSDFWDTIEGGDGDDKIYGKGGPIDDIFGGRGNDKIDGGSGIDRIRGEQGNDDIAGASGEDSIDGGYGSDNIYGGPGRDNIRPNEFDDRDFNKDIIDCGSGSDFLNMLRSSDGDTANSNCENINDLDG